MNEFLQNAKEPPFCLNDAQIQKFTQFRTLLLDWNTRMDLTAITDPDEIDEKHFLDSLSVFRVMDRNAALRVIDVGTGAGFPGIPLKIANPKIELTLLDSLQKRVRFLEEVIAQCQLTKTIAIHGRAEEFGCKPDYRAAYDVALSRAVAPLPTLLEYCLPFVRLGGYFYCMKGPKAGEEIASAKNALQILGGVLLKVDSFTFGKDALQRNLLVIKKVHSTPELYPRTQGKPRKKPL
uniref:16S rRNA (guanine(527)-N(7))-methyltransferase RsmG n=1 Tax=Ndongobacter massiliensis TaxID=1871025 RepID=UPI00093055F2|nr:16S rRNA (guanine(527)-N(7))-methyltransferase RsmG [Ndongobacter massiliensis]